MRMFDPGTRAYLRAIEKLRSPGPARALDSDLRFTSADRTSGRQAMLSMVTGLVSKPLRSLEFFAKLGAAHARRSEGS